MFIGFVSAFVCIISAIEMGRVIDQQYSDIGGKPEFVEIPQKWRWLFYKSKDSYKQSNKLVKMSLIVYLVGYIGFVIQMIVIFLGFISGRFGQINYISWCILVIHEVLNVIIGLTMGHKYNKNMRKSYDYDFLSYYIEQIKGVCKRKCRVVDVIDEHICEIEIGRFKKRRFKATTEIKVKVGEERYAMHYNHPIDLDEPYWEVRRH